MRRIRDLKKLATRYAYAPSTKLSHCDLFYTLHQLIKTSLLSWKFYHIKGLQDDGNTYNNIDEWGRMIVEADRLAKNCMGCKIHTGETYPTHKSISGAI